jgi:hypothetical protein
MKKSVVIGISVVATLAVAIMAAVIWDSTNRNKTQSGAPLAKDPLPAQPDPLQAAAAPAGDAAVKRLIDLLNHPDWGKRHAATEELKKIGKPAVPLLEQAANSRDAETSSRAKAILRALNGGAEPAAQGNTEGNQPGAMPALLGGAIGGNGAGAMELGALMNNPQLMDLARQMMAAPGGAAAGQPADNLGALMQNPQVQQMMQNPQLMQMLTQMLGGQGDLQRARGGQLGGNLGALLNNPQVLQMAQQRLAGQGGLGPRRGAPLARNAPAPAPAAALSTDLTATFGVRVSDANGGVRVVDVKPNTPASNAGLKAGDLIVSVNGRQVASGDELKGALAASGQTVNLDVQRRGDLITLSARK